MNNNENNTNNSEKKEKSNAGLNAALGGLAGGLVGGVGGALGPDLIEKLTEKDAENTSKTAENQTTTEASVAQNAENASLKIDVDNDGKGDATIKDTNNDGIADTLSVDLPLTDEPMNNHNTVSNSTVTHSAPTPTPVTHHNPVTTNNENTHSELNYIEVDADGDGIADATVVDWNDDHKADYISISDSIEAVDVNDVNSDFVEVNEFADVTDINTFDTPVDVEPMLDVEPTDFADNIDLQEDGTNFTETPNMDFDAEMGADFGSDVIPSIDV